MKNQHQLLLAMVGFMLIVMAYGWVDNIEQATYRQGTDNKIESLQQQVSGNYSHIVENRYLIESNTGEVMANRGLIGESFRHIQDTNQDLVAHNVIITHLTHKIRRISVKQHEDEQRARAELKSLKSKNRALNGKYYDLERNHVESALPKPNRVQCISDVFKCAL